MGVGADIKEVLADVGTKILIVRATRNISGEFIKYQLNAQVTKPFIREFFLDAIVSHDTRVVSGDIIEFKETSGRYLIVTKTPYMLENEVIQYNVVLYKTNVKINLERPQEIRSPQTLLSRTSWTRIKTNVDALLTSPLFGVSLDTDEPIGLLGIERGEMYIPSSYGAQRLDRIVIFGTNEYYRVESIKKRRYEDVEVVEVGEDVREGTTTSTTSSTASTTSTTSSTASTTSTTLTTTTTTTTS